MFVITKPALQASKAFAALYSAPTIMTVVGVGVTGILVLVGVGSGVGVGVGVSGSVGDGVGVISYPQTGYEVPVYVTVVGVTPVTNMDAVAVGLHINTLLRVSAD
jgi:hypothetical protein